MVLDISINVLIQARIVCKPVSRGEKGKKSEMKTGCSTLVHSHIGTLVHQLAHQHIIIRLGGHINWYIRTSAHWYILRLFNQHITKLAHNHISTLIGYFRRGGCSTLVHSHIGTLVHQLAHQHITPSAH
jgi:hypothetical protein